ncbi:MAG: hypothetical protein L3V56_02315 [Candidatus Magnetoovum sp. WYHC-5]|nr:hypothetical protein [Candidatus Magnetoovum sp. WYHC-5]
MIASIKRKCLRFIAAKVVSVSMPKVHYRSIVWVVVLLIMVLVYKPCRLYADTFTLLDAAQATGHGKAANVKYKDNSIWGCDVIVTGSPTAVTVRIEGNQGCDSAHACNAEIFDPSGIAEHTLTTTQLQAGIGSFSIHTKPVINIRANLVTLTGGTNPAVTVRCSTGGM